MTQNEIIRPEQIREAELRTFLNGVGNHEAKLLTATVILANPDTWFTQKGLHQEMIARQQDPPIWSLADSVPFGYCGYSLEPIGAVVKGKVPSERRVAGANAFKASDKDHSSDLALAGGLLQWSLDYPDVSLQHLLGSTVSKGNVRSPETRYQILYDLLSQADDASMEDIGVSLGIEGRRGYIKRQLEMMRDRGLVNIDQKKHDFNPVIKITSAEYRHTSMPLEKTSAETQAIYKAMASLEGKELSLEDFLVKVAAADEGANPLAARRKLIEQINGVGYPGIKAVAKSGMEDHKYTRVELNTAIVPAAEALIGMLDSIMSDEGDTSGYIKDAKNIINDRQLFTRLMDKARNASSSYAGHEEGTAVVRQHIVGILKKHGALSARTIMEMLEEEKERSLSIDAVRTIIRPMVKAGELTRDIQTTGPYNQTEVFIFDLPRE